MDYYKLLTDKLVSLNNGSIVRDLICTPTEHQIHSLLEGSGNPEAEMWQVNSSAGLAVNFWRAYELCHPESTVEFEWKKAVPLKRGIPANIDAVVRTVFIKLFDENVADALKKRRDLIRDEAQKCETLINDFIQKHLQPMNLKFRSIKYNDLIDKITDTELNKRLKQQYFL